MPVDHLKQCGDFGHKAKDGRPCGFRIADHETACYHHSEDKTRQKRIIEKMHVTHRTMRVEALNQIQTNEFRTIDDCLRVRSQIVEVLKKEKSPDYRRIEMILKATTGASTDHSTKAMRDQNEILLMLDGHGKGVAALQRLRESAVRVLPGRKTLSVVKAQQECAQQMAPTGEVIDLPTTNQDGA